MKIRDVMTPDIEVVSPRRQTQDGGAADGRSRL
jgi:hypothetical protein